MSRAPVVLALMCACGDPPSSTTEAPPNGAPSAPVVSIDPAVPADTTDLVCSATASVDPDGDALTTTVAWSVDGVAWGAGDTVPAAETQQGQVWTCEVTVSDGVNDVSSSAEVTIATWSHGVELTSCGATGRLGPTQAQCDADVGPGLVTVVDGLQSWTVPATGDYHLTAAGAQGGSGEPAKFGGLGATVSGAFRLQAGDVLTVGVGQRGVGLPENTSGSGGGGGGTWVARGDELIVVAGGGGGVRLTGLQDGCGGVFGPDGIPGSGINGSQGCVPALGAEGEGGAPSSGTVGAGGAGLNSSGVDDHYGETWIGDGGRSWSQGLLGGDCNAELGDMAVGGFGGGGCGGFHGGGGGGGYSGGGGGWVAGGAGSFVAGSAGSGASASNQGDGWVLVTLHEGE